MKTHRNIHLNNFIWLVLLATGQMFLVYKQSALTKETHVERELKMLPETLEMKKLEMPPLTTRFLRSFLLHNQAIRTKETQVERKLEKLPPTARLLKSNLREAPVLESGAPPSCAGKISIAHQPRYDLTGSFTLPTILLLAIAHRYDWELEIAPFAGSPAEETLMRLVDLGPKLQEHWPTESSGIGDASNRKDFDPVKLNTDVYETMGFFPKESDTFNESQWIHLKEIPNPGATLEEICGNHTSDMPSTPSDCATSACRLFMSDDPTPLQKHMLQNGGFKAFFTESLRETILRLYSKANRNRLSRDFWLPENYNIAIHVRRGEILNPNRWTSQEAFATVARRICSESRPQKTIAHVFSSGPNRDGNWTELEQIRDTCDDVVFHLDEYEFDTWAHIVFADELVISKSTFSYIPALISAGKVHSPDDSSHTSLEHWEKFRNSDGAIVQS